MTVGLPPATAPRELGGVGEEEAWISMQRVEVFQRPVQTDDVPWSSVGEGTVMWQQDGRMQRLIVVREKESESVDELACIMLPDPTLAISYLPEQQIIYWRNAQMDHEVALSFLHPQGCAQVWEDVTLLQEEPPPQGSEISDFDAWIGMGAPQCIDRDLPEPSIETLSQLVDIFGGAHNLPQVMRKLDVDEPNGERRDDFVGKLCALFELLDARVQRQRTNASTAGEELSDGERSEGISSELMALEQVAHCFKGLLAVGGIDQRLLRRLLRRDSVTYMLGALEYDTPHGAIETSHVNRRHREYVLSSRRFKMPVPILNSTVLECIHQNFLISYLTECVLPLSLDPNTHAVLVELQQMNGRTILEILQSDKRFLEQLFDGLKCSSIQSPAGRQDSGALHVPAHGTAPTRGGSHPPSPPRVDTHAEQLWALLRELCSLATPMHSISRSRFYKSLVGVGLFKALHVVAAACIDSHEEVQQGGGRLPANEGEQDWSNRVATRALEVLSLLMLHDPAVWRNAMLGETGTEEGKDRTDARELLGLLVRLLAHPDEGLIVQSSEVLRTVLDPSTMAPAEQNGFLDFFYGAGYCGMLISQLEELSRDADCSAAAWGTLGHVVRFEAILEVIGSTLGQHGYRSVRLAGDPQLWQALSTLLRQRLRSLRSTVARFVRTLISIQPSCAMLAVEHNVISTLFDLLMVTEGRRDSLLNSSILQLLHLLVTLPELSDLRTHVMQCHKEQLETLLAAGNRFIRDLLTDSSARAPSHNNAYPCLRRLPSLLTVLKPHCCSAIWHVDSDGSLC